MRLIDADALIENIQWAETVEDAIKEIRAAPTIEAEPVKRGKWIYDNQFHWYRASCSECGYMRATDIKADNWNGWKYCPNCGARMSERSKE